MKVTASDIYGSYVIDRNILPGPNADWQYDKYSFKITRDDKLILYEHFPDGSIRTCVTPVEIKRSYLNHRLKVSNRYHCHHVISDSPTMYRGVWNFHYVFNSPHYGNLFFRKVRWYEFWLWH